jgi:hypothetical protein
MDCGARPLANTRLRYSTIRLQQNEILVEGCALPPVRVVPVPLTLIALMTEDLQVVHV